MSVDWSFVRLKDYCTKIGSGSTPRGGANVYLDSGNVCLIRSQNIYNDGFSENGLVFISDSDAEKLNNVEIELNDVLINITGDSVARVCLAPKDKLPARVNQHVAIIRTVKNELDPKFVRYFLTDRNTQNHLLTLAGTGATRNALTKGMLEEFLVPKPDILIQKKISKILSDLDGKIHLNNQINQTLESIAQTIFKSWFIDFDPVRAKIAAKLEGADPEIAAMCVISGKSEAELKQMPEDDLAELQATAALFPEELVESELGEVPKGWDVSKISKIGKVVTGKTPSSKIENSFAEEGTLFITPTDIDTEIFVTNTNRYLSEHGEIAIKNSSVDAGSLCVTCIGSQMGKVVITPMRAFTNQQINSILLFDDALRNYIFLNLRQRREEIFIIGSGGSTMPIINKSTFESLNLILPDLNLIRKFDNFINPFFNDILRNSVENIEIKNIRDLLLPELLSGKINLSMLIEK